jgi:hypothetical protein
MRWESQILLAEGRYSSKTIYMKHCGPTTKGQLKVQQGKSEDRRTRGNQYMDNLPGTKDYK